MNKKALKIINYFIFLLLAIVLMYFCFKGIKLEDLIDGLRSANYTWIMLSVVVGMLGNFIRALRWRLIIEPLGYHPSMMNTYHAVMIGYLVNFAIPRAGEITRCTVLRKTDKAPFDALIGTVVVERVIDMICLVIAVALVFVLQIEFFGGFLSENIFTPLSQQIGSVFNFSSALWIILGVLFIGGILAIYIFRKELLEFGAVKKLKNLSSGIIKGLKAIFVMKHRWLFVIYTLILWITYWLTSYLTIIALPATASLTSEDALFLMVLGSFGWVAPVQGGFGAFHAIIALGLTMYGIPRGEGVIFATLSHESQAISMIIFGFISLFAVAVLRPKQHVQAPIN